MSTKRNPKQLDAIERAALELVEVIKPATDADGMLQEWPELATAVVRLATALGVDAPLPSPSATQPIATSPIFDASGRHIGFWRLCQQCRSNLPDTANQRPYKARGAVFCCVECRDTWLAEHPTRP